MQSIADDIIAHGKSREEHDKSLEYCLKRLEQRGLKLNPTNVTLHKTNCISLVKYFQEKGFIQIVKELLICKTPRSQTTSKKSKVCLE